MQKEDKEQPIGSRRKLKLSKLQLKNSEMIWPHEEVKPIETALNTINL